MNRKMSGTPKYYLKGNLSEKQIEVDVASFLGWCTPPDEESPFRLLDIDEQATGADKLFNRGSAIFIQFKKSAGLKSTTEVASSTRRGRSAHEDIREFRTKQGLENNPTLFFQLREKAKTAADFQHNILLAYECPPYSRGIYVAPLLLDKDRYHQALHRSTDRFLLDPFYYRLKHIVYARNWISRLGAVPFLREHVSIPPHERVATHKHFFAYSEVGTDISWHSPSVVNREPSRLSDFLVSTLGQAITNSESMLPIESLSRNILEISSTMGFSSPASASNISALDVLRRHGMWLKESHNIRQFLLLGNAQRIDEMRSGA